MFGEFIKDRRIAKSLTLREFCRALELDPSNWSKIERGIIPPHQSEEKLKEIANLLDIQVDSETWIEMKDKADIARGIIPKDILSDEEIMGYLPMFFRTIRSEKPTVEELTKLIDIIKKEG